MLQLSHSSRTPLCHDRCEPKAGSVPYNKPTSTKHSFTGDPECAFKKSVKKLKKTQNRLKKTKNQHPPLDSHPNSSLVCEGRARCVNASDVGFHKIFCTEGNDELVLQLLNAVIDDKKIVSFKRLDTKHQININTDATFDLYCTCDDDSRVIVECQNGIDAKEFKNRALAYSAMAILDKAHKQWHYMFDKVYFVGLLNFKMWRNRPQAFTKVALYTADDHILANDNYLQIFVELPKLVAKKDDEDFGKLFLRAMRDIGKSKTRQKEYTDRRLDTLFDASSYNHLSDEERKQYEESMTTVEDLMSYARSQREEGLEEGIEKGKAEGKAEGKVEGKAEGKAERSIEIARTLLSLSVDIATIVKSTGLSEAEIKAL